MATNDYPFLGFALRGGQRSSQTYGQTRVSVETQKPVYAHCLTGRKKHKDTLKGIQRVKDTYIHICIHAYLLTYILSYIYIHTYIHTYIT